MDEAFRARASSGTRLKPILDCDPDSVEGQSKAFAFGASELLRDAERLDKSFSDTTGHCIIVFHAMELALKSFLIKHGLSKDALKQRPLGHDLTRLYQEAERFGLVLRAPDETELIDWINEWHNTYFIRYEFFSYRSLPLCRTVTPIIERILAASKWPARPLASP